MKVVVVVMLVALWAGGEAKKKDGPQEDFEFVEVRRQMPPVASIFPFPSLHPDCVAASEEAYLVSLCMEGSFAPTQTLRPPSFPHDLPHFTHIADHALTDTSSEPVSPTSPLTSSQSVFLRTLSLCPYLLIHPLPHCPS